MKTINLLPKTRQEEIHYTVLLNSLWTVVILSLLSFAVVFLAQFGVKLYLSAQADSVSNQIEQVKNQVNKGDNAVIKQKIQAANDAIDDYNNLHDAEPHWSNVLLAFAQLPPAGVHISSFNVDYQTKVVNINGLSPTRDLVIQLYQNILNDKKDFYDVDYPLENLLTPVEDSFHFSFKVQDSLLK